jgi:hypothetical protein
MIIVLRNGEVLVIVIVHVLILVIL